MRASISKLAIAVVLAGPLLTGNGMAAESLKFGGTGTATEMLRHVGAAFTAASEINVNVIPNLGSAGAIKALADGNLDMAVSARPLKPEEAAAGLKQVIVLRTAFVLATSHRKPQGLKSGDLPKIYSAEKSAWDDGTPIRIVLRPRSETDNALLAGMSAGVDKAIEGARLRTEVPVAATDQDNANLAEHTPGALIGTTLTQLKTEKRPLAVLAIDGVAPTLENFESGVYPFAKKMFFIVRTNGASATQRFVEFLRSPPGVTALRATDTLPEAE